MDKQTQEFAIFCNLRLEIVDKLQKAIEASDIDNYIKYIYQLKFVDEKLKEMRND